MKKIIFILAVSLALFGCRAEKTKDTKAGESNKTDAENKAHPNNKAANTTTQTKSSGEKVEQVSEINFKDGLPKNWDWLDPDKDNPSNYETRDGVLRLKIPSGKDLYGENRTAPRLLKAVSGDFEIETKVKFDPQDSYQGAGILIFRNDNNYLRLERGFGGLGGGESGIRFDKREDEIYEAIATPDKFPTEAKEVELKIRRLGKEFTAFWRTPDGVWKEVGKYASSYPETVQVGIIGCNTAQEITAEFAYIKLSPLTK